MGGCLLIAVRFHEGRYHGNADRVDAAQSWPPSPARLFQALVAGAARGAELPADDHAALVWLECLDAPRIAAPPAWSGRGARHFVPNNDLDSVGGDPANVSKIRVGKRWRPIYFDAKVPVLYIWDFDSGANEAQQACEIAERLYQLGRGIDMAWACGEVVGREEAERRIQSHTGVLRTPRGTGRTAVPRPGTLTSLVRRFEGGRARLSSDTSRRTGQLFTQPPKALFGGAAYDAAARRLNFEFRGSEGGFAPLPIASVYSVLTGLRNAAATRLHEALPAEADVVERLLVGRGAGPRDVGRRVRLIALPSIGTEHTDPSIRRITVEVQPECPLRADDLNWAFAGLHPFDAHGEERAEILVSTDDTRMADRYARAAVLFRSITPLVLGSFRPYSSGSDGSRTGQDRRQWERRMRSAVVRALRHAGVRTAPVDIRVQREPFRRRGERADSFAADSRFSRQSLWHAQIHFREPVYGPLMLGDGRFCGLGLMEPVARHGDVFAFRVDGRNLRVSDRPALVSALRRALMSLARDDRGRVDRLFSGHDPDGGADRAGHHAHVFLAADASGSDGDALHRLLVVAPWAADRTAKPTRSERDRFDRVVRQLNVLRARGLGVFEGLVAEAVEDRDRLIGPATDWRSITRYVATRNLKKRDEPAHKVRDDVVAECQRRGLPTPTNVDVYQVRAGPRGGHPSAAVKLGFAVAVRGPIMLGRDSHAGGGLFRSA